MDHQLPNHMQIFNAKPQMRLSPKTGSYTIGCLQKSLPVIQMLLIAEIQRSNHQEARTSITERKKKKSTVLHTRTAFTSKIFKHSLTKTEILARKSCKVKCQCTDRGKPHKKKAIALPTDKGKKSKGPGVFAGLQSTFACELRVVAARMHKISPHFPKIFENSTRCGRADARSIGRNRRIDTITRRKREALLVTIKRAWAAQKGKKGKE